MKKGDTVYYTQDSGYRYRARVVTVHRDGTLTVSPQFVLRPDNTDAPGYLGDMKFRVDPVHLRCEP
jgi:hypothetical protein